MNIPLSFEEICSPQYSAMDYFCSFLDFDLRNQFCTNFMIQYARKKARALIEENLKKFRSQEDFAKIFEIEKKEKYLKQNDKHFKSTKRGHARDTDLTPLQ